MLVEVSIGEVIDKYNILEIKSRRVLEQDRKTEILKELDALVECKPILKSSKFLYKILNWINESIWDKTNEVKELTIENPNYSKLFNEIFELNQKRFRVKKIYNTMYDSTLKEQKSYVSKHCIVKISSENEFFNRLSEINFLMFEYDTISFDCTFIDTVKTIYKFPNILYANIPEKAEYLDIETYTLDTSVAGIFDFEPLRFGGTGHLGDFVHQLSVVYEMFRTTGRRAEIFIRGPHFRFPLQKVYDDLYNILISQSYIKSVAIDETSSAQIDYDLTAWRDSALCYKTNWYYIFKDWYKVEWGAHKWLDLPILESWKDKIIITCSPRRLPTYNLTILYEKYKDNLVYLAQDSGEYDDFKRLLHKEIPCYVVKNLYELVSIINSCHLYIGNLSAPLAFALSFHKRSIVLFERGHGDNISMKNIPVISDFLEYYE